MKNQKEADLVVKRKKKGFTQVYNHFLEDPTLSWKAKGLFIYMLSKPDNWKLNIKGDVTKRSTDKERAIYSGINELVEQGYISRTRDKDFYVTYHLFEDKNDNKVPDYLLSRRQNADMRNSDMQNAHVQNSDDLIRLKDSNTEYSNTEFNTLVASKDAQREQVDKIVEMWNQIEGLPQVRRITETSKRYKYASARLKEEGFDTVVEVIQKVASSDFLRGKNRNNWTANFEWAMTASNFIKILEDTYINKESNHEAGRGNNSADKLERIHEEGRRAIEEFDFENFDGTF